MPSGKYLLVEIEKYKNFFKNKGAEFEVPKYTIFQARGNGYVASFYQSGKYLIQGQNADLIAQELGFSTLNKTICKENATTIPYPHIGVDESGKGDFFGPLVIAGVLLDENQAKVLGELGICDSKKLSDKKIFELVPKIKQNSIFSVVAIGNKKYNELYLKFKNLNKLLAWGHSTVIENILTKSDVKIALCDQFGNEKLIKNALKTRGKEIELHQMPRAEADFAVAAASILARGEFVSRISKMSKDYNMEFLKGASDDVKRLATDFAKKFGKDELSHVSKTHFKTFNEIQISQ